MSTAEVVDRVNRFKWVHSIDLGNGVTTPGEWGAPSRIILDAFDALDFRNKKVLDIGCWDGLWSFEAERRGAAEVYATDDVSQRWGSASPTLLTAREILGSRIRYEPNLSVFHAPERFPERDFDIVIFAGIYYHLKDPLLALARLRQVLKAGGYLIVEGDVLVDRRRSFATFWYRDWWSGDRSNWWIPTIRCLHEWLECSFFEVKSEHVQPGRAGLRGLVDRARAGRRFPRKPVRRMALTAQAVTRRDPNYSYPDVELSRFDLKEYPAR